MGYEVYWEQGRWKGYGVPAKCDFPGCEEEINRGLSYLCEATGIYEDGYTEDEEETPCGCGLYFCLDHEWDIESHQNLEPSEDTEEWLEHVCEDDSWEKWREREPAEYLNMKAALEALRSKETSA